MPYVQCCSEYGKFKKMTIEEFNNTRFGAGMTMRLHKSDELKLIVSVDFEEALLA